MATRATLYTADDLRHMPGDEPLELWDGELRAVPSAGGKASGIGIWIGSLILAFALPRGVGWITGADGSYVLARNPDTVVVPDAAFIRWERLPDHEAPDGLIPVPPDLAVEVVSPTDRPGEVSRKQELYRRAGVPLVWWVYPKLQVVAVQRDGHLVEEVGMGGMLDGGDVLPGFELAVDDVFAVVTRRLGQP